MLRKPKFVRISLRFDACCACSLSESSPRRLTDCSVPMRKRFVLAFVLLVVMLLAGLTSWAWVSPEIPIAGCTLERNAAWLSVDWTAEAVDEDAIQQLADDAADRQLCYLFPFATYVQADGSFSPSYGHASEFVMEFRRFNHETQLLAWIGVPLQKNGVLGIDGWVNIADQHARLEIAAFAARLVQDMGFDGVHLDAETVQDGNRNYLLLLDEMRMALGPDYLLSTATGYWIPAGVNRLPVLGGYKWSGSYYQEVAVRVGSDSDHDLRQPDAPRRTISSLDARAGPGHFRERGGYRRGAIDRGLGIRRKDYHTPSERRESGKRAGRNLCGLER